MSTFDIDMSELCLEDQTTEVYVSLMSMMRIEYDGISAMELDEEVNETIGITAETEQFESEQEEEENNSQEKKPDLQGIVKKELEKKSSLTEATAISKL